MNICRQATQVKKQDNFVVVDTNACQIRIWFLTDHIIRIRASFDQEFKEESYVLTATAWEDRLDHFMKAERIRLEAKDIQIEGAKDTWRLVGKELDVIMEKEPFTISILDKSGNVLHRDIPGQSYLKDSNQRIIHTSEMMKDDYFYGFGEKTGTLNKRESFMSMSPRDTMGYNPQKSDSLYKHIPFYIKLSKDTQLANGYFYHNTYECDFDMGRSHSNYWKPHTKYRADGGDIDLFFIHGPQIRQVIERYTDLTGKSAMLPKYALGYLGSTMYYSELPENCDDEIMAFIDNTELENIPVDGFQLSSGYSAQNTTDGDKRCVFTWNEKRFPDPERFFLKMMQRGVSVSPNVKPGILSAHPRLSEFLEHKMFVKQELSDEPVEGYWWGGTGYFIDFTNENARQQWKTMLIDAVISKGTSSIWNDNCEYESIVDKDARCSFEGQEASLGRLRAIMPNLMCHITKEAIREEYPNERPFIVCRSGHSGIQRYAQTWAGDNYTSWDSLKYNIATILGMSLSGVANQGVDIGGFYGNAPSEELLVRWVQNGIFQPRFSIHSVNSDNSVTEPWMYENSKGLIAELIQFRYRMMPYLYSLMQRASETGLPYMEPLVSAFQHDSNCYDEGVHFMVGDALLVANIVEEGQTDKAIYLPAGCNFYNFYTRECYSGGATIQLPVDLTSIPMFVKSGGIIPLAKNQIFNLRTEVETQLHMICADDADGQFVYYEDDGITYNYQNGAYKKTTIKMESGTLTKINFSHEGEFMSPITNIQLDIIHPDKVPFMIKLNGNLVPHLLNRKKFENVTLAWYYDMTLSSVQVKYPVLNEDYEVEISYEDFDMIGM